MPIHVVSHPDCLAHDAGPGHPERPDRLKAVLTAIEDPLLAGHVERHEAPFATTEQLLRVHPEAYLGMLEQVAGTGGGALDPDTVMNGRSWDAARRAAGGAALAACLALEGRGPAFAAVRPPGHHAEADRAMGFCLLNNVVVAAREALAEGCGAVLIVDWDVHHGNGTQQLVEQDVRVRYVSLHQWPYYPGTGAERERGVGNVWNVPMRAGLAPDLYVEALLAAIDASLDGWAPGLILVSAGFDAMAGDPLAGFTLRPEDYETLTRRLLEPGAPLAGVLEGGYGLDTLAAGVTAFLKALLR